MKVQPWLRRRCVTGALAGALFAPLAVRPQPKGPVRRLGLLEVGEPGMPSGEMDAFIEELARRGYVEGSNLVIERRYAYSDQARFDALAAELVALKPDVIFSAAGTRGAQAIKAATTTIPVVFDASSDPVGRGLVADLARPGGNLTGTLLVGGSLDLKRLQLLIEVLQAPTCIAVLSYQIADKQRDALQAALAQAVPASRARPRLLFIEVARSEDLGTAFERMSNEHADALVVIVTPLMHANATRIAALAAKHRLPAIADGRRFAEGGLLLTYSTNFVDLYRRGADYVARILNGAKPADLPIEQVSRFDLVVNLKTAKALGIDVPRSLLIRADSVIR